MANAVSDGDLVVAEVIDKEVGLLIGDRSNVMGHPALTYLGNLAASGSTQISRDLGNFGLADMTAPGEATTIGGATDFAFTRVSVTVARQALQRSVSELLGTVDPTGTIKNPQMFAMDALGVLGRRFTKLVATVGATFTNDYTPGSGTALDWATLLEAKGGLVGAGAFTGPGNVLAILNPKQWSDLQLEMLATGLSDAATHAAEGYNALLAQQLGYQGRYYGIDIFTTTHVAKNVGETDYVGCIVSPTAVAWADAQIQAKGLPREMLINGGKMHVHFDFDGDLFADNVYYNAILGVAKGVDAAGATITSGV